MPVVQAELDQLVEAGTLQADPLQSNAAAELDRVLEALRPVKKGFFARFQRPEAVRGAYLVGDVGRGKTMLMDLFFSSVPIAEKRRVHFHEFMDEVHAAITAFRATEQGRSERVDPVEAVAKPLARSLRLLCLDEFQVNDITNAMLLGRLFAQLFAGGVTLVATSNVPPDRLYWNGLNRQLFLPFIDLLKQHVSIVRLDGETDYRRLKISGEAVFQFGPEPAVAPQMDRLWRKLTGGAPEHRETVRSLGRDIVIGRFSMGAARMTFSELCDAPLGARDYLKLAHTVDTLMIDGIPQFTRQNSNAAKRFILLVDTLYDRHLTLAASFAVPLDQLGEDEQTRFEFARCVSRLTEMQSEAYLSERRESAPMSRPSLAPERAAD